jgi:integrase
VTPQRIGGLVTATKRMSAASPAFLSDMAAQTPNIPRTQVTICGAPKAMAMPIIAPAHHPHDMDLALIAGMDSGTIRSLERRHLTDEGILFERRKTGTLQLIEWNDDLRATIEALKHEPPQIRRFLIANRRGQPYTANGFEAQWQRAIVRATKPGKKGESALLAERFTFHDLRAKSASASASDQDAADRLGHGDVKLTRDTYRRLPRRAAALKILDNKA